MKNSRRHRGILATLALLALVLGGTGVGWYYAAVYLPHPRHASTRQLLRWMVQRDLQAEPYDVQLALADRLEQELKNGLRVGDAAAELDKNQQDRLRKNVQQLKFIWFASRADRYFDRPLDQRFSFLTRQLETIHLLTDLHLGLQSQASSKQVMADFFGDIEDWIGQSEGVARENMQHAVHDGVVCWLATGDMRTQTSETRRELAIRIAAALDGDEPIKFEQRISLPRPRRVTLRDNAILLFEAWFQEQARRYEAIPHSSRDEFVYQQILRVDRWGILDFLIQPDDSSQQPSDFAKIIGLSKLVNSWIERASDGDRARMRALFTHVQRQLLSGNRP